MTGTLEKVHFNEAHFNQQYHNFQNFGKALDPTDHRNQSLVFSSNIEGKSNKSRKAYRRELKRKR